MQKFLLSTFIGLLCSVACVTVAEAQCAPVALTSTSTGSQGCTGTDITYTAPVSATISDYQWTLSPTGEYSVTAGSLTSGTSSSITIKWLAPGTVAVQASYQDSNTPTCRGTAVSAPLDVMFPQTSTVTAPVSVACPNVYTAFTAPDATFNGNSFANNIVWSIDGGVTSGPINGNTIQIAWSTPGAKTVSVTYTPAYGTCPLQTGTPKTITVSAPIVDIVVPTDPVCVGTPITYTATGLTTYQWWVSANNVQWDDWKVNSGGVTSQTLDMQWTNNGGVQRTLRVVGTDANGCSGLASKTVNVKGPSILGPSFGCVNGTGNAYSINSNGLTGVTWSLSPSVSGDSFSSAGNTATANWGSTTTTTGGTIRYINVTADGTTPDGCTVTSANPIQKIIYVMPRPAPYPFTQAGINGKCIGTSADFGATKPSRPPQDSFQWSVVAPDVVSAPGQGYDARITWGQSGTRTVTLYYTDQFGCQSATGSTQNVTIGALPVITLNGSTLICSGSSTTLTASGATGTNPNYVWAKDGTTVTSGVSTYDATSAGSYTVTWTDPTTGCIGTSNALGTTVIPSPTVSITPNIYQTFCAGTTTFTATAGLASYTWYNYNPAQSPTGITTQMYAPVSVGSYSVAVKGTDANGCSTMSPATGVTVMANPTLTTTPVAGNLAVCSNAIPTLNADQASLTYQWYKDGTLITGATGQSYLGATTVGGYTVKATDANSCSTLSGIINVTAVNAPPSVAITQGASYTVCESSPATLSVTSTPAILSAYSWNKGSNPTVISAAPSLSWTSLVPSDGSSYTIKGTDANGCSNSYTGYLNVSPKPTPNVTANKTTACADNLPALTTAAVSGHTYAWYNTLNPTTVLSTSNQYSPSISGTYYVVEGTTYCGIQSNSITVTINPLPNPSVTPTSSTTCSATPPTLTTPNVAGNTYKWYDVTNTTTPVSTTSNSYTATALGSHSYYVIETTPQLCSRQSNTVSTNITQTPTPTISPTTSQTICFGTPLTLTAGGGASFQWYNGSDSNPVGTGLSTFSPTAVGTYNLYAKVSNGSCFGYTSHVSVTINAVPSNSISPSTSQSVCQGTNVSLTAGGGNASYSYQWYDGSTPVGTNSSGYTVSAVGVHSMKAVVTLGTCALTTAIVSVTITANPTPSITSSLNECSAALQALSTTLVSGHTYAWYKSTAPTTVLSTSNQYTPTSSGTYYVKETVLACTTQSNSSVVTVTTTPIATISPGTNQAACQGSNFTITAGGGGTYQWYNGSTAFGTTASLTLNTPGTYVLHATVTNGSCSANTSTVTVTINAKPTVDINYSSLTFCQGQSAQVSTTNNGNSFSWYNQTGYVGSGATQTVTASGTYYVVAQSPTTGCSNASSSVTFTMLAVPSTPSISVSYGCGVATLTAPVSSAYQWSTGATTQSINVSTNTSYTVRVQNSSGCWSAYGSVTAAIPAHDFTVSKSGDYCPGGQVTLSATPHHGTIVTYRWSTGDTQQNIVVFAAGSYWCDATFSGGCVVTQYITVLTTNPPNCPQALLADPNDITIPAQDLDEVITETTLFPNPANKEINITTPVGQSKRKLSLVNLQGVTVQTSTLGEGESRARMPLGILADGIYLLIIESDMKVERHKIMIRQ
jgi:hypothetical protein